MSGVYDRETAASAQARLFALTVRRRIDRAGGFLLTSPAGLTELGAGSVSACSRRPVAIAMWSCRPVVAAVISMAAAHRHRSCA